MKKLIFTLFLFLSVVISSNAQKSSTAKEFYSYLNSIIKNKKIKSIQLLGINYGALGIKFNWETNLKKNGKQVEIEYKSQQPNEDSESSDLIVMGLDTTFVTTQKKIIQNFETETTAMDSRPVYFEEKVKIVVNTEQSNKEFVLKRIDGLSFLLRYDLPFEEYYKQKIEK